MFNRIFYGLLGLGLGFFALIKNRSIVNFFGRIDFAEKYLGATGTYTFWKLLGIVFIIFSFLYLMGTFNF